MTEPSRGRPALRVVRGNPTPEELAALFSVLSAGRAGTPQAPMPRRVAGGWADRAAGLRRPLAAGPGSWRAAGRVPGTRTRAGV